MTTQQAIDDSQVKPLDFTQESQSILPSPPISTQEISPPQSPDPEKQQEEEDDEDISFLQRLKKKRRMVTIKDSEEEEKDNNKENSPGDEEEATPTVITSKPETLLSQEVEVKRPKRSNVAKPRLMFSQSFLDAIGKKKSSPKKAKNPFWPKKVCIKDANYNINRRLMWPRRYPLGGSYVLDISTEVFNGYVYSLPQIQKKKDNGDLFVYNLKRDDLEPLKDTLSDFLLVLGKTVKQIATLDGDVSSTYLLPSFDRYVEGSLANLNLCAYSTKEQGDVVAFYKYQPEADGNKNGNKDKAAFHYRLPLAYSVALYNALETICQDPDYMPEENDDDDLETEKKLLQLRIDLGEKGAEEEKEEGEI